MLLLKNFKRLLELKSYIYGNLNFIIRLKAFNKKQFYVAILLATLTVLFEGLGVSILIPC